MGNHLHLLLPEGFYPGPRKALIGLVGRAFEAERIPEVQRVQGLKKQRRMLRYVLLNPCRAGLTRDPTRWLFSTLRDDLGAVTDPWTGVTSPERLLAYLETDDRVRIRWAGPAPDVSVALVPLGACVLATQAALRARDLQSTPARRTFVHLARRQGWTRTGQLAQVLGVTPRAVQQAWHHPDPSHAARICLANSGLVLPSRPDFADREAEGRRWGISPPELRDPRS